MAKWLEYASTWCFEIHRDALHPQSIIEIPVDEGVVAVFGERRSKFRSRQYLLSAISFDKTNWNFEEAHAGGMANEVRLYHFASSQNRKVPPIKCWGWLKGGHVFLVCERGRANDTLSRLIHARASR
jgi:hypothetical protein